MQNLMIALSLGVKRLELFGGPHTIIESLNLNSYWSSFLLKVIECTIYLLYTMVIVDLY